MLSKRLVGTLSTLSHSEGPWQDARRGIPEGERGTCVITHASMAEFYSELVGDEEA